MTNPSHQKVTAKHLSRQAFLYVRQSTLKQVFENTESTRRQYALRDRAVALGWPEDQVIVIDDDLGKSGATSTNRFGFQRLVSEVGLGHAGIVLGLEVSRLARNSMDWHRLLEICALSNTLILDEDGLYDPADFNDRLLLGMKGTFSEAELHVLRTRMRGGVLNAARRGDLWLRLPTGFVYDPEGRVVLDPDEQVQGSIRYLFDTFRRTRSACKTVRTLRDEGLLFPLRIHKGPRKGQLEWVSLCHSRVCNVLHNPRYAGVFTYGRTEQKKDIDGKPNIKKRPMDAWISCVVDAHEGYITWPQFQDHQQILADNAQAHAKESRTGPPREGPALLQGLVLCGRCGRRMSLRYHDRKGRSTPDYVCQREKIEYAAPICQVIPGANLDDTIAEIIEDVVSRATVEISVAVQDEIDARTDEADRLWRQRLDRTRHEAELARERYMCVDPRNRLVADSLERTWNEKLREVRTLEQDYEERRAPEPRDPELRERLGALVRDFPTVWNNPKVSARDRKRVIRLVIEDVTLTRNKEQGEILAHVRFRGGATRTVRLSTPVIVYEHWKTRPDLLREIDLLLDAHTERDVARVLAERGVTTSHGKPFRVENIAYLRKRHGLKHRRERLRDRGFMTLQEIAAQLGVSMLEVDRRALRGEIETCAISDRNNLMYRAPAAAPESLPEPTSADEVQYA
jgi:DNA invertase Pin-like site-specific DNA recombinase